MRMGDSKWRDYIESELSSAATAIKGVNAASVIEIADVIVKAFDSGNQLLIAGNGGSASDASHLAAEFVNRLTGHYERRGLPAIALTTDVAVLTSIANDYNFNRIFSRQVAAHGKPGDVLMVISTSGNSKNCRCAVRMANLMGLTTVAVTGGKGGRLARQAKYSFNSEASATGHIQGAHLAFYHLLVHIVEREVKG